MHPLINNLQDLSDSDLHKKHGELISRINQAHRIGPYSIISQLQLLLDDYNTEIDRRNRLAYEQMISKSKIKDGIIDIK